MVYVSAQGAFFWVRHCERIIFQQQGQNADSSLFCGWWSSMELIGASSEGGLIMLLECCSTWCNKSTPELLHRWIILNDPAYFSSVQRYFMHTSSTPVGTSDLPFRTSTAPIIDSRYLYGAFYWSLVSVQRLTHWNFELPGGASSLQIPDRVWGKSWPDIIFLTDFVGEGQEIVTRHGLKPWLRSVDSAILTVVWIGPLPWRNLMKTFWKGSMAKSLV